MLSGKFTYSRYLEFVLALALLLYWGRSLFIPLSFAWLLSILLYPLCKKLELKGISRSLSIALSLCVVVLLVASLVFLAGWQLSRLQGQVPAMASKFSLLLQQFQKWVLDTLHISLDQQINWFEQTLMSTGNNLGGLLTGTIGITADFLLFIVIVPLFAALILSYRRLLVQFLYALLPVQSHTQTLGVLSKTITIYHNYVKGLLLIYLIVAVLNSLGLYVLGIEHAILYGTLASILTIIPYVGIAIGSLLPITLAWLSYDSIWYPVGVILWFMFVQYLEANIIFPWIIGQRLKVNTLVSLIALFVGGIIWGASGMVLFLPFVAILKIIAENIPEWKALDILLGPERPQEAVSGNKKQVVTKTKLPEAASAPSQEN
ncbi:AI-2E family transporter [Rhodocytophaga rosea]|uniref:AI-2E family transporter n=1 Tax=Rhodocytophaga rosea TaxID=2704465 RepID=A0A6C0GT20_9BACT|nr:AI-2E family transporter [Rhodocytophaga rosea]QHT71308.1 AI-2E family transporter [Rhodocytophaga rosea]